MKSFVILTLSAIALCFTQVHSSGNITNVCIEDSDNERFEKKELLPASPALQSAVLQLHMRVAESAIRYLHGDMVSEWMRNMCSCAYMSCYN